jgi:predicted DNA-binding transcriptional regulator AlpA
MIHAAPATTAEYLTLKDLIVYSGMSRSTLKRYLRETEDPLPRASLPRERVRVRRSEFDHWYARRGQRHEQHCTRVQQERDAQADRIAEQFFASGSWLRGSASTYG